MASTSYDLLAIGNALVDVLSPATDEFIDKEIMDNGMIKGGMSLINECRAVELYAAMGAGTETSGGSAANTMAGFASFGGSGAYIGKVAQDQLGDVFRHDMKAMGVTFATTPLVIGSPTGRCLVLIAPDGERTMNTYLGASSELGPIDIDESVVSKARITYLEGYLFDEEEAKKAFRKAGDVAHQAGRKVALTLSDSFCVDRHRGDFLELVENYVDILFANEDEIKSLYRVDTFEEAVAKVKDKCDIVALTRGKRGSVILSKGQTYQIDSMPVEKVVDSTGAGDQYAAGFLFGLTKGLSLEKCGALGTAAASEVISHVGPRPLTSYAEYVSKVA